MKGKKRRQRQVTYINCGVRHTKRERKKKIDTKHKEAEKKEKKINKMKKELSEQR